MKKNLLIIAIAITAVACASKKAIVLTQTDADRASSKFSGATLASLTEGKTLYENNCGTCHGLKNPGNYGEAEWRKIVPPMAVKANVDAKKEELILQYVVTMGKP